ncbi:M14 family zinc carboxypeptidase [Streptomyces sp. 4N124]|uniref:M14 family zinc carboxypeptidase n=1 Tax=Streptomyces sp. 4N124 TaxID=3457420 RepID=UPI003FCF6D56
MRTTRTAPARPVLITALTLTTAGSLLLTPGSAGADTEPVTREGPALDRQAALTPVGAAERALAATVGRTDSASGYPREQILTPDPENPADKSIKLGLTPYHAIAPKLNALQSLGDRVSVEVTGRSAGGHRLYLVTVTAPESAHQTRAQERMRELIAKAPAVAAKSHEIKARYKVPLFVNNNIHGNEWEGTDASLGLIKQLATANDTRTRDLLSRSRLYFNITANPDGRIAGTRANAGGFDMNRDFVTASQPEVRAMRQIQIDKQPAVMLDLHGYVNGTLIEPTTPPHGENYEYDLFLKNTYANALGMESAVNGLGYTPAKDGVEPAQIPFRDQEEGWDDWPPIFTPQYAAFQGTVAAHTVEIPLAVNNEEYDTLPTAELRRRSAINVDVAGAAIRATLDFTRTHRTSLIADQIEVFRRGAAGEAQIPVSEETVPGVPGIGPEDVYTTNFPRAYVIPAGPSQRSATAAARLVDHLLANDVTVTRATRPFRLAGRTYAPGSYVIDMHQSKRGLANVLLADGTDISDKVSVMYDISGWSLGRLWGATVKPAQSGSLPYGALRTINRATPVAHVAPYGPLRLRLDTPQEIAALNDLLQQGISIRQAPDGSAILPPSARKAAVTAARTHDVTFEATHTRGTTELRRLRLAAAVTAGELFALREMNFEVTPVSTAVLNAGFDWSKTDALFVSAGLSYDALNPAARKALDTFLTHHGGLVGRGATGADLTSATGLLAAKPVEGNGDANGVVRVVNRGGRITGGAADHSFVYAPVWFTDLGPEVRVEQSYTTGNPLLSGHWRPLEDGSGGPGAAAGQASVVSGPGAVLFGTEPLFRDHPKGQFAQVARALFTVAQASQESGG